MNKSLLALGSLCFSLMTQSAWAECAYPKAPDAIPDASSATEQQMINAMQSFKEYNASVDAYVACLDEETSAKVKEGGANAMQIKSMQAKKKSTVTDERQAKVNAFNEQVRAFKAKKG